MNNFVFSGQDPLLFQSYAPRSNNVMNDSDLKMQMDNAMMQYQNLQQHFNNNQHQTHSKDYLGELDSLTRGVDPEVAERLNADPDYMRINAELQMIIQEEMLKNVKYKINTNPEAINRMNRLTEIITFANKEKNDEERRNMIELNDYIKNYSDLTFDEYKKLKKIK